MDFTAEVAEVRGEKKKKMMLIVKKKKKKKKKRKKKRKKKKKYVSWGTGSENGGLGVWGTVSKNDRGRLNWGMVRVIGWPHGLKSVALRAVLYYIFNYKTYKKEKWWALHAPRQPFPNPKSKIRIRSPP